MKLRSNLATTKKPKDEIVMLKVQQVDVDALKVRWNNIMMLEVDDVIM